MKKTITLLSLFIATANASFAQIPNSSFENWTTGTGYMTPDNWDNLNTLTSAASIYTCEQGGLGAAADGSYFLKLTTKTVAGTAIPGIAVCGQIDLASKAPKKGFPFTGRPASFTGKWQYMASGADAGYIGVWLTKWNTTTSKRDTVASKVYSLPGMMMVWADFDLPLNYISNNTPDSATIGLSSSGLSPVDGSYLFVDKVAFSGTAANVPVTTYTAYNTVIYPNPATNKISIDFGATVISDIRIRMTDMFGRTTKDVLYYAGKQIYSVDLDQMPAGIYFITMQAGEDVHTQRVVIQ